MTYADWQLLTPANIQMRRLWGWGYSVQKILAATRPNHFDSDSLMIASDYSGEHREASHLIYCYLIVAGGARGWHSTMRRTRVALLRDGRRMCYKRLDDAVRRKALFSYLSAAADLHGCLVAIAVDKRKTWLSTQPGVAADVQRMFNIKSSWSDHALEKMMRKVQFLSLILSIWARHHCNVTWITDQDEFVANDARHDDALAAVGQMASLYTPGRSGLLRLNTTNQDPGALDFEDLCAIPDLAAGMLSETSSCLAEGGVWENGAQRELQSDLSAKADHIANWFWDDDMPLRKTLISVDMLGEQFAVRRVHRIVVDPDLPGKA